MENLRKQLVDQLTQEHAHISFYDAVKGLEQDDIGIRPQELPHSIWELVEHIRIAQEDIVKFCVDSEYKSPEWPDGYWPDQKAPSGMEEWEQALQQIESDLQQMVGIVKNPDNDLLKPIPHGDGQTLFREAILSIDHNSYHTGQIVTIRRLLGLM